MRLDLATWREVEAYLANQSLIVLPTGSTEQHGPVGLIGSDALCAQSIARRAAATAGVYVAPTLAYTPAPLNTAFPGTVSVSVETYKQLVAEIIGGLHGQGFDHVYVLNAHGANLDPIRDVMRRCTSGQIRLRSWWDFDAVTALREKFYGDWEGMHATPSEVAITQALFRTVTDAQADLPPRKLSATERAARAGDRHEGPVEHRAEFPDGRVGSHSALALPEHGHLLLAAACEAVVRDIADFAANCVTTQKT